MGSMLMGLSRKIALGLPLALWRCWTATFARVSGATPQWAM